MNPRIMCNLPVLLVNYVGPDENEKRIKFVCFSGASSMQMQPLIIKPPSPPPAYDDVVEDTTRFPCASPTTVCAVTNATTRYVPTYCQNKQILLKFWRAI